MNGGRVTDTYIDNHDREYAREYLPAGSQARSGSDALRIRSWPTSNPRPAVILNQALRQGLIKVIGHRNLRGRDTILLRVLPKPLPPPPPGPVSNPDTGWLVWLDARTYLIAQVENTQSGPVSGPNGPCLLYIVTVTWLAPTPANLALLRSPLPAGFTRGLSPANADVAKPSRWGTGWGGLGC